MGTENAPAQVATAGGPAHRRYPMDTPESKACTRCRAIKHASAFGPAKRNRDGLNSWCRDCCAEDMRERRARNPDAYRARDRARYAAAPEVFAARARRARKKKLAGDPGHKRREWYGGTDLDYIDALIRDPCAYCGAPSGGEVDHIVPTSEGGDHDWTNFTGCCRSCNPAKGKKSALLYLAHRNGCYEWRCDTSA